MPADHRFPGTPPSQSHMGTHMGGQVDGHLPSTCEDAILSTHGRGTLTNLIRNSSHPSLAAFRKSLTFHGPEDEESLIGSALSPQKSNRHSIPGSEDFRVVDDRRMSEVLSRPQMRSQRLIGNNNPRYKWEQYWKTDEQLKAFKKPLRQYYERTNSLIQQYIYIDRLLDSSIPHDLLNEYNEYHDLPFPDYGTNGGASGNGTNGSGINGSGNDFLATNIPATITEELHSSSSSSSEGLSRPGTARQKSKKVKRTPRNIYKVPDDEESALLSGENREQKRFPEIPDLEDDSVESGDRIVQVAIYINLAANIVLLAGKIVAMLLTDSLSVLASLVDAALDFLSTAIVWVTTHLISKSDSYLYPVGRRRLEPLGVLVFAVIMVISFFQVGVECFKRLTSGVEDIVELTPYALGIMLSTVFIKGCCWLWCRLIKNSSVQALAQDAMTDIVFNICSIIFPLVGTYAKIWWLDALGGLLLSIYVISNWASTSVSHIRNLTGAAATADERNVLLYLTMRFAKTIQQIQGLQAYHSGDKLNVEVEIVLDENMSLRDSHDLGESLQYVLESVPIVDRAFVHIDYKDWNLPSHLQQQSE